MYWNIKEVEAADLQQWMEREQPEPFRILDVRQPTEIAQGTIPSAHAMPMHTIPMRISELSRDERLVLVCRSGARSAQACMFLQQQGFENVYNLRGGMIAWSGSGLATAAAQA